MSPRGRRRWWQRYGSSTVVVVVLLATLGGIAFSVDQWKRRYTIDPVTAAKLEQQYQAQIARQKSREAAAAKARLEANTLVVQRPQGRPLRVEFAGDSLTVGWGASTEAKSFRARVTRALSKGGPVQTHLAGVTQGDYYRAYNLNVFGQQQDLAIVEIGTNDRSRSTSAQFAKDYAAMLDRIRATSPRAKFLCLGIWHQPDDYYLPNERELNSTIASQCRKRGGEYVDVGGIISDETIGPVNRKTWDRHPDDFHPNDEGHAGLARAILRQLDVRPS